MHALLEAEDLRVEFAHALRKARWDIGGVQPGVLADRFAFKAAPFGVIALDAAQ